MIAEEWILAAYLDWLNKESIGAEAKSVQVLAEQYANKNYLYGN